MKPVLCLSLAGLVLASPVLVMAQSNRDNGRLTVAPERSKMDLQYGKDPLQKLDYWSGREKSSPIVVFVHGGGWRRGDKQMMEGSAKLDHWRDLGFAVASINYRLVPEATVEQQAADVASAISFLKKNAGDLGFDAKRIALVGHSAGAHLVALVGTDPSYFHAAGMSPADVRGIIPLDGAGYDVPKQIAKSRGALKRIYVQAFGTAPERQKRLSPINHVTSPNAPAFLILHVQYDKRSDQSSGFGEALRKAGTPANVQGFEGRGLWGHLEINRRLGEANYPATPVVDAFLNKLFVN